MIKVNVSEKVAVTCSRRMLSAWQEKYLPFKPKEGSRHVCLVLDLVLKVVDITSVKVDMPDRVMVMEDQAKVAIRLPENMTGHQAAGVFGAPKDFEKIDLSAGDAQEKSVESFCGEESPSVLLAIKWAMGIPVREAGAGRLAQGDLVTLLRVMGCLADYLAQMASLNDVIDLSSLSMAELKLKGMRDDGGYCKDPKNATWVVDKETGCSLADPGVADAVLRRLHYKFRRDMVVCQDLEDEIERMKALSASQRELSTLSQRGKQGVEHGHISQMGASAMIIVGSADLGSQGPGWVRGPLSSSMPYVQKRSIRRAAASATR